MLRTKQSWRYPLLLSGVLALTFLLFFALYHLDNKYTQPSQPADGGVLRLEMEVYEKEPLLFLVGGWEYYSQQFLSPEQVALAVPDAIVFIGQYAGFDAGNSAASPHGKGTWRLTIFCDEYERDYALELPEIYSAYKIWVNGTLKKQRDLPPTVHMPLKPPIL